MHLPGQRIQPLRLDDDPLTRALQLARIKYLSLPKKSAHIARSPPSTRHPSSMSTSSICRRLFSTVSEARSTHSRPRRLTVERYGAIGWRTTSRCSVRGLEARCCLIFCICGHAKNSRRTIAWSRRTRVKLREQPGKNWKKKSAAPCGQRQIAPAAGAKQT